MARCRRSSTDRRTSRAARRGQDAVISGPRSRAGPNPVVAVPPAPAEAVAARIFRRLAPDWPAGTLFVVYCAGPHCNGADRAALRLAELGRSSEVMVGGAAGWADEGPAFERGI